MPVTATRPVLVATMSPGRSVGSVVDVDARQPERIAAVAGAAGDQLLAIEEGGVEIGVAAAVGRDRVVDAAAGIEPRLAGRAERVARLAPRSRRHAPAPGSKSRRRCARSRRSPGRLARAAARRCSRIVANGSAKALTAGRQPAGAGAWQNAAEDALENALRRSRRERSASVSRPAAKTPADDATTSLLLTLRAADHRKPLSVASRFAQGREAACNQRLEAGGRLQGAAGRLRNTATRHRRGRSPPTPPSSGRHRACR